MNTGNTISDMPKNTNNEQPHTQPLEGEELKQALKRQVEFYFSRQNLAHDSYLLSQMGPQMFVPISVLVQFSKVKELTVDTALVASALKDSKVCTLNDDCTAVRPNIKTERNTIILREIPSETPTEEVQAIFGNSSAVTGVRSDVGDTWFVTMETEDDAVKTLLELRSKTFQGKPIKARLKSENLVRSFYPAVVTDVNAAVSQAPSNYYGQQQPPIYHSQNPYNPSRMYQSAIPYGNVEGGRYNGRNGSRHGGARNGVYQHRTHSNNMKDGRKGNGGSRKGKDKKGYKGQEKSGAERQPILNAANFPPLPTSGEKATPESGAGYSSDEFIKYAHDDIMDIIKNMSEEQCRLESGRIDFEAHSAALTEEANPDLLRNQRTYSIDQAREALRQGRPIRSDSIGSIDYESMIYGEEYTKEARQARASLSSKTSSPNKSGDEVSSKTLSVESDVASESSSNKVTEPQQEPQPKKCGYAAALLNGTPAPPAPVAPISRSKSEKKDEKKSVAKNASKKSKQVEVAKEENNVVSVDPVKEVAVSKSAPVAAAAGETAPAPVAWGEGKRSFLDVLKTKNEVSQPVVTNQVENQPTKKPSAGGSGHHVDGQSGREKERRGRHSRENRRHDKHERNDDRSKHEHKSENVSTTQAISEE